MTRSFFTALLLLTFLISYAQKIPFQGKLTENDLPYSGSVDLEFSISSVDWTELHQGVGVLDGFYSVVLGSINPLPDTLFDNSDEVSMVISVNGEPLSPVTLYAPYGTKNARFVINETTDTTTTTLQVLNHSTGTSFGVGSRTGAYIEAKGEGQNTGLFAYAENGRSINNQSELTDPNAYITGQLSSLYGNSDVGGRAMQAQYTATGPGHGVGLSGYSGGGGQNWGLWGRANSVGSPDSVHVGAYAEAYGGGSGDHYGIQGKAYSPNAARNIGVYGTAHDGINENWAGFFEGNVNVNGQLMINGEVFGGGTKLNSDTIEAMDIRLLGPGGNLKGHLNYFDQNSAGSLELNGANDSTKVILGSTAGGCGGYMALYDSLRNRGAEMRVNSKGVGNLFLYDASHQNSAWLGNLSSGGILQIVGYDTAGVNTGAMYGHHPGGLPSLILESNNNGDGPFSPLVHLNTYDDGLGSHKGEINVNSSERVRQGVSSGITMSISPQEQPFIELKSGNDLNWDVRGQFRVDSVGTLGTAGRFELLGPLGNANGDVNGLFSIGAINDQFGPDPGGTAAELFLWGTESPNIQMAGSGWQDHDLGYMNIYGSVPDAGGWYYNALSLGANTDGAGRESGYINLNSNQSGDSSSVETVMINGSLFGSGAGGIELKDAASISTITLNGEFGSADFAGDVNINGNLNLTGNQIMNFDTIDSREIRIQDGLGAQKGKLFTSGDAGELELKGQNDSLSVSIGSSGANGPFLGTMYLYDSIGTNKAQMVARNNGGYLQLDQKDEFGNFQSAAVLSSSNSNSFLSMYGQNQTSDGIILMMDNYINANQIGVGNTNPLLNGYRRSGTDWKANDDRVYAAIGNAGTEAADPNGFSGYLTLYGTTTKNAQLTGKRWENNDLPIFQLFGLNSNIDGSDTQSNIDLQVLTDTVSSFSEILLRNTENGGVFNDALFITSNFQESGSGGAEFRNINGGTSVTIDGNLGDISNIGALKAGAGIQLTKPSAGGVAVSIFKNAENGGISIQDAANDINKFFYEAGANILEFRNDTATITASIDGQFGNINIAGTLTQASDKRLKKDIVTQTHALEKVKQLRGVEFAWKDPAKKQDNIGFIAQEIEEVYPELVTTRKDGYKGVDYASLVSALVEAIKELDQKVTELEAENSQLKAALEDKTSEDIASLKAEIEAIKRVLGTSGQGASK